MLQQGLDNQHLVQLPEGISIAITPAGFLARSCAYLIDFAIRLLVSLLVIWGLSYFEESGWGVILIVLFIINWGYNIVLESRGGQTLGKKHMQLRVVQDNGLPASLSQIIIRNLLRTVDLLPMAYCLGLLVIFFNKPYKRIGDWAAGTLVIYNEFELHLPQLPTGHSMAPKVQLSTHEQQAILSFAERSQSLSTARQQELAEILSEQLKLPATQSQAQLMAIARYYAGQSQASNA